MPRKSTPSNMRRNCDDRMRKFIVARGQCQRCGDYAGPFECAHIVRRRYAWTRTDERNAWCLCIPCHRTVDTRASVFDNLVEETIGSAVLVELEEKAARREKFDWAKELERWKEMA